MSSSSRLDQDPCLHRYPPLWDGFLGTVFVLRSSGFFEAALLHVDSMCGEDNWFRRLYKLGHGTNEPKNDGIMRVLFTFLLPPPGLRFRGHLVIPFWIVLRAMQHSVGLYPACGDRPHGCTKNYQACADGGFEPKRLGGDPFCFPSSSALSRPPIDQSGRNCRLFRSGGCAPSVGLAGVSCGPGFWTNPYRPGSRRCYTLALSLSLNRIPISY